MLRTQIIALIMLMLLVAPVGAGTTHVGELSCPGEQACPMFEYGPGAYLAMTNEELARLQNKVKGQTGAHLRVKIIDDPCRAQMEAAMKAVHPFLMLDLPPVGEQIGLDLVKKTDEWRYEARLPREELEGLTPEGLANTLNARAGRAIVLWDTAKRECWK